MRSSKIVQINTVVNNSTGRIMHDIQREADSQGYVTLSIVGRRHIYTDLPCVKCGNGVSFWLHVALTTLLDFHGCGSYFATKKMIRILKEEEPDIIHLHNIHGYYLNISLLFKYLKNKYRGQIVWTLHDLWPITGHCPHYIAIKCEKWKTGCNHCPNKSKYPISLFWDNSKKNYLIKKHLFTEIERQRLTLTVPSEWMHEQLKESFLSYYECNVINNGIDTDTFNYLREDIDISSVLKKYSIDEGKKILLSVASIWDERKGLKDIIALSNLTPSDYIFVVVGLNNSQIKKLPDNIIGLHRTENLDELVTLYCAAHIFINPSLEESFSLVTVEAQACGTPCVVLDNSAVANLVSSDNGIVLHEHKAADYLDAIYEIERWGLSSERVRATAIKYSNEGMLSEYMALYKKVLDINE